MQSTQNQLVLESNLLVLVDFTATWCGPCKILDPIIDGLMPEMSGHAKIFKLDIDESPEIYVQLQLTEVPTVVFSNKGNEQDRTIGPQSREVYIKHLEGLRRGTPALDIKITPLGEDSFRLYTRADYPGHLYGFRVGETIKKGT